MAGETIRIAAAVVCDLGLVLCALAGARHINHVSVERFGVCSVNIFSTLLASIVFIAAGLGLASSAMASGWEPFEDARAAFPWPYREPDDASRLGVALPVVCAAAVIAATAILARRATLGLALGGLACLTVLGLATANPVVFPVVLLLAVFEWGHKINERSEEEPMTGAAILLAGLAWICVAIGACVSDTTLAGVLAGVGATGLLALFAMVWRREGPLLALETLACATLQATLYSTFVALLVVGFASGHSKKERETC